MSPETHLWVKAIHLVGVIVWVGALLARVKILRVLSLAPADNQATLGPLDRAFERMTRIGAVAAISCGLVMLFHPIVGTAPLKEPWMHTKLTLLLVVLAAHAITEITGKRVRTNTLQKPLAAFWMSVTGIAVVGIVIMAVVRPF